MSAPPTPDAKRQQLGGQVLESTAEHYARMHGIPDDVLAGLQSVGRKSRQVVSVGRTLQPTQSLPVGSSSSFFSTDAENIARAKHAIFNKDLARAHELPPMGQWSSATDALSLSPRANDQRLSPDEFSSRGLKRNGSANASTPTPADGINYASPTPPNTASEFPPVFTSPVISHPALASTDAALMPPPPVPARATRSLPRRGFSKTVSAPVLGGWGMDVDAGAGAGALEAQAEEEDGFDVSEWARSEEF